MRVLFLILLPLYFLSISAESIDPKQLKCLVCKRLIEEMEKEVEKVDPKKTVEVGSYHFDNTGTKKQKKVEYRRSEVYLTELMERICNRMEDYVRARKKTTGQLVVVPLITESGQMSPEISSLDIVQDSDLNRSLKFYCEGILEDFEDGFIKEFSKGGDNLDIKLCSDYAKLCNESIDNDYEFEKNDEL